MNQPFGFFSLKPLQYSMYLPLQRTHFSTTPALTVMNYPHFVKNTDISIES